MQEENERLRREIELLKQPQEREPASETKDDVIMGITLTLRPRQAIAAPLPREKDEDDI